MEFSSSRVNFLSSFFEHSQNVDCTTNEVKFADLINFKWDGEKKFHIEFESEIRGAFLLPIGIVERWFE